MKDLASYRKSALHLALEWEDRLTKEEWKTLYDHLQTLSLAEWEKWKDGHKDVINDLLVSPVAKALKELSKFQSLERLLYIFAISQRCLEAYHFLELADRCCFYARQGVAAREMIQNAAECYSENIIDTTYSSIWNWSYPAPYRDTGGAIFVEMFLSVQDDQTIKTTRYHKPFPAADLLDNL